MGVLSGAENIKKELHCGRNYHFSLIKKGKITNQLDAELIELQFNGDYVKHSIIMFCFLYFYQS